MKIEKITIDKFEDEDADNDTSIKRNTDLKVVNDEGGVFITDTYLDIVDGKTVDEYTKDAYDGDKKIKH